jgi:hypothetical protein
MAQTREQIAEFIASLGVGDVVEVQWSKDGNRSKEEGKVWQPPDSEYLGLGPDLLDPNDLELVNIALLSKAPITIPPQPPSGSVAVFALPTGILVFKRLKKGWYAPNATTPLPWSFIVRVFRSPTQVFRPGAPPSAPVINTLTPGDARIVVDATLGDPGSTPIIDVQYLLVFEFDDLGQETTGWISSGQVTGAFTILNLTNDIAFSVRIRAVNSAGAGPASNLVTSTPVAASS